jgi:hypothetical protein
LVSRSTGARRLFPTTHLRVEVYLREGFVRAVLML